MEWARKRQRRYRITVMAVFLPVALAACNAVEPEILLATPDAPDTLERVTFLLHNQTDTDANVDIFIDDAPVTYPVSAGKILSIRLRCAHRITYAAVQFLDASEAFNVPVNQQVLRDLDYNCDDVLVLNIHGESPELRVVVIDPDSTDPP